MLLSHRVLPSRQLAQSSATDQIPKASSSVPLPQYTLLSFSTGQILEDQRSVEYYRLFPHELLELHTHLSIIKLSRELIDDYVKPYFEARVWALRVVVRDDDGGLGANRPTEGFADPDKERLLRKRKTKLQWQERWVIIHRDIFQLCKDRSVCYLRLHLALAS